MHLKFPARLDPSHDYHCLVPHGDAAMHLLPGSVTHQVLAKGQCDVLVVR